MFFKAGGCYGRRLGQMGSLKMSRASSIICVMGYRGKIEYDHCFGLFESSQGERVFQ